jgi:hypothetical protein
MKSLKKKMIEGLEFYLKGNTRQNVEKVKKEGSIYKYMKLREHCMIRGKNENI